MLKFLKRNAELITAVCVLVSLVLGGALIYILHARTYS